MNITPQAGDGTSLDEAITLRLGEIYGFSDIPIEMSAELNIPRHWYGYILAYLPGYIEIQMLPYQDYPAIHLPLSFAKFATHISTKHFPSGRLQDWNAQLKYVITITDEHIELITSNPELFEDWKIYCLYKPVDERVAATYTWLTSQTEWFETDVELIDWIYLTNALIDTADNPKVNE